MYGFISQLITFEAIDLEKLFVYCKNLNRKLPKTKKHLPYEVQDAVDLDSFRIQQTYKGSIGLENEDGETMPISSGVSSHFEDEADALSIIVEVLNETYGLNLSEEDKVDVECIGQKIDDDEELSLVMNPNNSVDAIRIKFDAVFDDTILDFVNGKLELYKKLSEPKVNALLKGKMFESYQQKHLYR